MVSLSEAICAGTGGCSAIHVKTMLVVRGCLPCYLLSLDRCEAWEVSAWCRCMTCMVWEGTRVSQHTTETFVTAKHLGLHFAPLGSGFQALQGFNTAKGYQSWGTRGCRRATGLWFSKGEKKRSVRRAVLMPWGNPLLVLLDRRVLDTCEADELMKVGALWRLTCSVKNVLQGVYEGQSCL